MAIALETAPATVMPWLPRRSSAAGRSPVVAAGVAERDREFVALLAAFRRHGGLLREGELGRRVAASQRAAAPLCLLWNGERWWPWFQFDRGGQALNADCVAVAAELATEYDAWQLAGWFAEPNTWLAGRRPVDGLYADPAAVRAAARADRFVLRG